MFRKEIATQRLVLVTDTGRPRGVLGCNDRGEPEVVLFGRNAQPRASLRVVASCEREVAVFALHADDGQAVAGCAVDEKGELVDVATCGLPAMTLGDDNAAPTAGNGRASTSPLTADSQFQAAINQATARLADTEKQLGRTKYGGSQWDMLAKLKIALEDALIDLAAGRLPSNGMGL